MRYSKSEPQTEAQRRGVEIHKQIEEHMRWPETKDQPCQFCGAMLHLKRVGTAPEYKEGYSAPKRGTGYYYTSSERHRCAEGEKIRQKFAAVQAKIESAIFGRPPK